MTTPYIAREAERLGIGSKAPVRESDYHFARTRSDAANRLMSRLLWHVEASDGGFIGLTDAELEAKVARDPRLIPEIVAEAMWNAGSWPKERTI